MKFVQVSVSYGETTRFDFDDEMLKIDVQSHYCNEKII